MAYTIGGINGTKTLGRSNVRCPCTHLFAARRHHRTNGRHPHKSSANTHVKNTCLWCCWAGLVRISCKTQAMQANPNIPWLIS